MEEHEDVDGILDLDAESTTSESLGEIDLEMEIRHHSFEEETTNHSIPWVDRLPETTDLPDPKRQRLF
jgi:hypothetical protein